MAAPVAALKLRLNWGHCIPVMSQRPVALRAVWHMAHCM